MSTDLEYIVSRYNSKIGLLGLGEIGFNIRGSLVELVNASGYTGENLKIPNFVNIISSKAFRKSNVKSVVIPSSVVYLEESAFSYCYTLEKIRIEEGLKAIGDKAFRRCIKLNSINIPNSVESIGINAFEFSDLKHIKFEEHSKIRRIQREAFSSSSITEITIPKKVSLIEAGAFDDCAVLEKVIIESEHLKIETFAFNNCDSLRRLDMRIESLHIIKKAFSREHNGIEINLLDKEGNIKESLDTSNISENGYVRLIPIQRQ